MLIARENFVDAKLAADVHRYAIGQAVAFVETSLVKFHAS